MSEFDWPMIVNLGWGAMLAAVGWFVRQLWDAVATMKRDLHDLEVHLPTAYVQKEEMRDLLKEMKQEHKEDMLEIKTICEKIITKIDEKADK